MSETFKDVVISGAEYRLGVFSPKVGAFIMMQLPSIARSEETHASVLDNCLDVVSVLRERDGQKFPFKLYSKEYGKWMEPAITNPATLNELMMQTVNFNLDPFIRPSKEQGDSTKTPDTPQSSSLTA